MAAMLPFSKSCVKYQTASCVRVHSEPIPFHIQVNINAQDQDRSGFDHLLAVGWTYVSCDRSISAVWRNGPLRNDRPLDNQSRPPATDTGQELWKLIGARLSIMPRGREIQMEQQCAHRRSRSAEDFRMATATNLSGFFYVSQLAVAQMRLQRSGHVVNVTTSLVSQPVAGLPASLANCHTSVGDRVRR
jgi:hypothetical protein